MHDISTPNRPLFSDSAYNSWVVRSTSSHLDLVGDLMTILAKHFPTAVISGRSRDKVKGFVQLSNAYYAGSHEMNIMVPPRRLMPCDGKNHTTTMDKKVNEVVEIQAVRLHAEMQVVSSGH